MTTQPVSADLAREAIWEVLAGPVGTVGPPVFAGYVVRPFYQLPVDERGRAVYETLPDGEAAALIYTSGGTIGDFDRVDRATVEVYAPGTAAVRVLEAVTAALVNDGFPHDLSVGYVDEVTCDVTPNDVPFPVDGINQARAGFLVRYRPVETWVVPESAPTPTP